MPRITTATPTATEVSLQENCLRTSEEPHLQPHGPWYLAGLAATHICRTQTPRPLKPIPTSSCVGRLIRVLRAKGPAPQFNCHHEFPGLCNSVQVHSQWMHTHESRNLALCWALGLERQGVGGYMQRGTNQDACAYTRRHTLLH